MTNIDSAVALVLLAITRCRFRKGRMVIDEALACNDEAQRQRWDERKGDLLGVCVPNRWQRTARRWLYLAVRRDLFQRAVSVSDGHATELHVEAAIVQGIVS